jgi:hypothetical protein
VTAPEVLPVPQADVTVGYDLHDPSGVPVVIAQFVTGAASFTLKLDARIVPEFAAGVANGLMAAAQQALTLAGPRLLTPPAAGSLIIPNGGLPRPEGRAS